MQGFAGIHGRDVLPSVRLAPAGAGRHCRTPAPPVTAQPTTAHGQLVTMGPLKRSMMMTVDESLAMRL